jgi:YidC/Oxa1 family membrane protein insertase
MTRVLALVPIEWTNPINVIIGVLENSIGWVLAAIYSVIPSYGVAIIILTILIRLLLYPIMARSTKSMRKMQQLQPYVKKLQEKNKGDRQKLSEEQMALFKANNVSPISGCLPLIIQMPILLAMFRVINGGRGSGEAGTPSTKYLPPDSELTADLNQSTVQDPGAASFLGMNLAMTPFQAVSEFGVLRSLPYFVIVALIVLTGWYQQRQIQARNAGSGQQDVPQAMRTMTRVFPIFFGLISISLPAGVNIYFLTSNLFQIGQQYLIIKQSGGDDDIVIPKALDKKPGRSGSPKPTSGKKGGPSKAVKSERSDDGRRSKSSKAKPGDGKSRKPPPKKVAPKSKQRGGNGRQGGQKSSGPGPQQPGKKKPK